MVRFIFESLNLRQDVQRIQCLLQGISICKPIVLITRSTCVAPSISKSKYTVRGRKSERYIVDKPYASHLFER